jgi:hypothetical protein
VRHVEPPVQRAPLALGAVAHEHAVRQREQVRRHGDRDLRRRLLVRRVDAREPVPRVLVLALGPRLERLPGVPLVGPDEVEAAPRRAAVRDPEDELAAGVERARQLDAQPAAVVAERRGLAGGGDRIDLELDRVELDAARARRGHRAAQRGGARQRALARIDGELEREVPDDDDPIGRELRAGAGERELTGHRARV